MGGHRPSRIFCREVFCATWCDRLLLALGVARAPSARGPGSHRHRLIPPKTLRQKKTDLLVGCWWFGIESRDYTRLPVFFDMFFFGGGLYISSTKIFLWPTTMNHDEWMEWDEILVASVYPFVGYVFFWATLYLAKCCITSSCKQVVG